ncbi:MAG TPA: bacillithiol system redox-active protein YtxJ [Ignavibacteria bacterium]
MNWSQITKIEDIDDVKNASKEKYAIIFKHSTGCSGSKMALSRFERNWKDEEMTNLYPYFLDLLKHREVSNKIAAEFKVKHESPQLLLIKDGKCIYNASHHFLDYEELQKRLV